MKRLISLILVSSLVVGLFIVGIAENSDTATATVSFHMNNYLALNVTSGSSVSFNQVEATDSQQTENNATRLQVLSNTRWSISTTKAVTNKPGRASKNDVTDALAVEVKGADEYHDDKNIRVDYTLSNFRHLPPGNYAIKVTFTATAK